MCAGDSGSSVRSSMGVRGIIGWSLNGSNDGYATTLQPYRPWFERNVVGTAARFCNPSWPVVVRGHGTVDVAVEGGVVARHRTTGGDVDPWDAEAVEEPSALGLVAGGGATFRVRGNDPLAAARLRITVRGPVDWPAGQCTESTATTCAVALDPTSEERLELASTAAQ